MLILLQGGMSGDVFTVLLELIDADARCASLIQLVRVFVCQFGGELAVTQHTSRTSICLAASLFVCSLPARLLAYSRSIRDGRGFSPLMYAAQIGNDDAVREKGNEIAGCDLHNKRCVVVCGSPVVLLSVSLIPFACSQVRALPSTGRCDVNAQNALGEV